jgi:hypothetical protein
VKYNAAKARILAGEAIRAAAQTKDNPADLINVALDMLIRQGCELPGYTTLDEATKTIRTQVNGTSSPPQQPGSARRIVRAWSG